MLVGSPEYDPYKNIRVGLLMLATNKCLNSDTKGEWWLVKLLTKAIEKARAIPVIVARR